MVLNGLRREAVDLYKKNQFEAVEELLKPVIGGSYILTDAGLLAAGKDGVPEAVIGKIKPLKDKLFDTQASFIKALSDMKLTKDELTGSQDKILKCAATGFAAQLVAALPDNPQPAEGLLRDQQRQLVSLALTNSIKGQRIDRAEALLDILEKAGGTIERSTAQMKVLMEKFREQADDLRKMGPTKDGELKKLSESVSKFLEKIAKKGDALTDDHECSYYLIEVAKTLSSIGEYGKANDMLTQIRSKLKPALLPNQPPPAPKMPKEGASADELKAYDDALKEYEAARIKSNADKERHDAYLNLLHGIDHLLAKNYWAAKDYPKALEKYEEIVGNTKNLDAKAKKWGSSSLTIRKELAMMREDIAAESKTVDKWAEAIQEWRASRNNLPVNCLHQTLKTWLIRRSGLFW